MNKKDLEEADIELEKREHILNPEGELHELAAIYEVYFIFKYISNLFLFIKNNMIEKGSNKRNGDESGDRINKSKCVGSTRKR